MKRLLLSASITLAFLSACYNGDNLKTERNDDEMENDTLLNKTKYTYTDSAGIVYPIYLSKDGKAFIIKISEDTGKEYRKYLPLVTKELEKSEYTQSATDLIR